MSNKDMIFEAALLTYIMNGQMEKAKSIIRNMSNVQKLIDYRNCTLLHYAAKYGNGGIAKYLIELGSDVNHRDEKGQTPLMMAVQEERITTIRVLLENNASIHITDKCGNSALHMVVHGSSVAYSAIQAFLNKLKVETSNDNRLLAQKLRDISCPLIVAVFLDDAEVTRVIYDEGNCKVDARDPETEETALHIAVRLLSLANIKLLLEYGANVNAQSTMGCTPLQYLDCNFYYEDGSLDILKMLLNRGAMIFTENNGHKRCQISHILEHSCRKTINVLMQYDIDLCAVDKLGNTVLYYLGNNKNVGVFDELQGKNLSRLALHDDIGMPITDFTRSTIEKYECLKKYYDLCKYEINSMKKTIVWESITKYKLLTVSEKQLVRYVCQRDLRAVVSSNMFYFESCYDNLGRERLQRAISTAELWENSINSFCTVLNLPYEKYYDVIENMIISYLSKQDMRNLCLLVEK